LRHLPLKRRKEKMAIPTQVRKTNYRPREMVEVHSPQLFRFTKETPVLEGTYRGSQTVTVKTKPAVQHMIEDGEGNKFLFLETCDLQKKLSPSQIGRWMTIEYLGEDPNVQTSGYPLRKFRVSVDVTDEDVPF
jgi:hypothetical protein